MLFLIDLENGGKVHVYIAASQPGADPEISFRGPRGAEGAEVERRRREDRGDAGADGVGCRCEGSGEGAVPPPQKFFSILHYKMACFGRF